MFNIARLVQTCTPLIEDINRTVLSEVVLVDFHWASGPAATALSSLPPTSTYRPLFQANNRGFNC